jgi:hypothetical protein
MSKYIEFWSKMWYHIKKYRNGVEKSGLCRFPRPSAFFFSTRRSVAIEEKTR